ncbi:hypothetical protein K505DRAFT_322823 [Melanomma pulvis-pyrius CBS 109.77]|uniref:Ser/Thr protein phosphatase superfamily n=1 Tax=Melanomma pulvis-pyrius CBS 109.77 TaxID=1314802 RepID=A0A6A6XMF5_9PLEO|nr:hypothetical protein K505DRAFT_322823 [Melanomma pulvis-pyrius CBS 109.77]
MKRFTSLFSSSKSPFQILSDLHLNNDAQYLTFHIPVTAPHLILAGNIGRLADYDAYLSFLIRRCNLYTNVFLVLGSLEFHGITIQQGLDLARRMESEPAVRGKLVILNRTRGEVPGTNVTILGCTLWSKIAGSAEDAVLKKIPEFDREQGIRNWSVASHNAAHDADLAWLQREVQDCVNLTSATASSSAAPQILVVTSFAPELREALSPWQVDSPWSSAYGTELLRGMDWNGVKVWVCGATGRTGEFKKYGVKVVMNQRGCVGEEEKGLLRDGISEKEKRGLFDVLRVVKV